MSCSRLSSYQSFITDHSYLQLRAVIVNQKKFNPTLFVFQRSTDGFWKSVARQVPREPSDMRILNPYYIQEASFKLIGLPYNNGHMGRGVSQFLSSHKRSTRNSTEFTFRREPDSTQC